MRKKEIIRKCKSEGAHGDLIRLNDNFWKCTRCGEIIGSELVKRERYTGSIKTGRGKKA